jgi:uncharacterized membrane protein YbhN (UPF0104 family)
VTARPRLLAIAATAALGVLVVTHARAMAATVTVLGRVHVGWVLALLGLAIAGPFVHSELLRSGQATVGARFGRWEATRLAAGIHAANLVVRAAGIAGLGVLLAHPGERSIARAARSAAYLLGREVAHLTVAAIAFAAVALLGIDERLRPIVVVGAVLFFVSRVVHAGLLALAAVRPQWLPRWRRLDRVRAHAPAFATALRRAAARPRRLVRIAAWALTLEVLHVGWLWVALHAVGASTSIDATFETYGIVALLATVSVLPAGLGAVDAGLVAALHHSGVGLAAAGAGVLLYRVAELWVPLLAGARPALAAAARQRIGRRRSAPAPMPAAVAVR